MGAKYMKIFNDIADKISKGIYKVNSIIPSEASFANKYNVSRDTVRKSLSILEKEGYIQKIKGKGSIVLDVQRYDFSVTRIYTFKEIFSNLGKKYVTKVKSLGLVFPSEKIKKELSLSENDKVWRIIRVREIDNENIILDKDYLCHGSVESITEEICENSIYEYIENELNLKIAYAKKEITTQMASEDDIEYLDMKDYQMVVVVKSYTYLDDTTLFHYTESRHRPDKFNFIHFARR